MKLGKKTSPIVRAIQSSVLLAALVSPAFAFAQAAAPTTRPRPGFTAVSNELKGRPVEAIRIVGNSQVPTAIIMNQVRTREGEPFDPTTVEEDYQRIFDLKRFANVEAKVEPTSTGVIIVFSVTEQKQIRSFAFNGNVHVDTLDLQETTNLKEGEAIDSFRIALAKQSIERLYRDKNFPYAHVDIPQEPLAQKGELIFNIVEGPKVTIRRIAFDGNKSFSNSRLRSQIKSDYYILIFRPGTFDPDQVEDDVASLRRFYEDKGFFDVRVGRKLAFSRDQREMQITFVINEGPRYTIERVSFKGNAAVSEADLRKALKMTEGQPYDNEVLQRDIREIVRAYSPFGFIYLPPPATPNPDYLHINTQTVYRKQAGKVELVYEIHEGKPFKTGRVLVKGNAKTQDKVILREMRVAPGQLYNSAELADAADRLRGTPFFTNVNINPIGDAPDTRDVLVEVMEGKTASFNIGAGVSSNGGVAGDLTYEQRNFDIGNWPSSWHDVFSERAFVGAGQTFRASFSPGTQGTNASIRFTEPWLFDQPYSFTNDLYLRYRIRENWDEDRIGDRVTFGKRFDYVWSAYLSFRAEDVNITSIEDPVLRAPEILDLEGHSTVTSAGPSIRRDTTNHGPVLYRGTNTVLGYERVGAMGGDFDFNKYTFNFDAYKTVYEDLIDRKTVLGYHLDTGYINGGDAPFFEKYYGGGYGSIRGFKYRGISPRSGLGEDPVGGNFFFVSTVELNFPIYSDVLRGVIFNDTGTVEDDVSFGKIRSSVGFGIRMSLPFFGQMPLALDFAIPIAKDGQDDTQFVSFSFGTAF